MYISFCTTCMNRTWQLKQTIFINLEVINKFNEKYSGIHKFELSLCNYNSKDELDEFVNTDLKHHLNKEYFTYIKIYNKIYFNVSHAKNVAHKNSHGDILISLDADNFINDEYIENIIEIFSKNMNVVTHGDGDGRYGRICISRENFYKLGGYLEILDGYGFEDNDIINRSEKYYNCEVIYTDIKDNNYICNSDKNRIENYNINNKDISDLHDYIEVNIYKNSIICKKLLEYNIINPNEYYGIIFGEK